MPEFPIIDTHVHLWDPRILTYPWLAGVPLLNRPYLPDDHRRDWAGIDVEAMVFLECDADPACSAAEAAWVVEQSRADPRIRGMVAHAPLERGHAVEEHLAALRQHALLRGVRRLLQSEDDAAFCLRPGFIAGAGLLARYDLSFDICITYRQMASVLRFVDALPDLRFVLDHIGKPNIRDGALQPWAGQMRELARHPNVVCKISGVATEARPDWTEDELDPFVDVAFTEFGFDRTLFGGDWPVALQAITPSRWVGFLDRFLSGASEPDRRRFWRDNAKAVYRL